MLNAPTPQPPSTDALDAVNDLLTAALDALTEIARSTEVSR